jgi:hypothetical protein
MSQVPKLKQNTETQAGTPAETSTDALHRREQAIMEIFGLWSQRTDIPMDGVEYQRELRREWQ